jgi:hypothetical protein
MDELRIKTEFVQIVKAVTCTIAIFAAISSTRFNSSVLIDVKEWASNEYIFKVYVSSPNICNCFIVTHHPRASTWENGVAIYCFLYIFLTTSSYDDFN